MRCSWLSQGLFLAAMNKRSNIGPQVDYSKLVGCLRTVELRLLSKTVSSAKDGLVLFCEFVYEHTEKDSSTRLEASFCLKKCNFHVKHPHRYPENVSMCHLETSGTVLSSIKTGPYLGGYIG
jgi:hypothetical protein